MISNSSLDSLDDSALLGQFGHLVRKAHEGSAQLLRHIDVIDRRKLWARLGHPTLFDFLVTRYHMSEATAFKRIGAARTARRFPVLFEMVGRGEIHLSGIHRLKAHLTCENHEQVLALAQHKTIRQIEALVAHLAPRPDVPTTLRALPNRTPPAQALTAAAPVAPTLGASAATAFFEPTSAAPVPAASALAAPAAAASAAPVALDPTPASGPAPLPPRRDPDPEPLAPGRYKLTVTISESTRAKLKQLEDLLARQIAIPKGDTAALLDRALDALLTVVQKRKIGITAKPRAPRMTEPPPNGQQTRHVKASVRREVWPRDEGRCGFVGEDGHRCDETRGLQLAHKKAWAKGGANTAENIGLRCPAHNALEADRDYGAGFMARRRQQKQQKQQPLKVREPLARYVLRAEPRATLLSRTGAVLVQTNGLDHRW